MVAGLLFFGSGLKGKFVGLVFAAALMLYVLFTSAFTTSTAIIFSVVNIVLIASLALVNLKIKNKYVSAAAMLVYSIIIDVLCYSVGFVLVPNISLLGYVASGLMFNLKNMLLPFAIACVYDLVYAAVTFKNQNKSAAQIK